MSDSELREELDHHQAMLQQYKKNLRQIERSAASFSPTQIPLSIQNEINAENKRIAERKQLILETQQAIESVNSQRFRSNWHSKQKPIRHYLLFWHNGPDGWAARDWSAAQEYIGLFTPTCGFSALEAVYADKVTIIGATDGIAANPANPLPLAYHPSGATTP